MNLPSALMTASIQGQKQYLDKIIFIYFEHWVSYGRFQKFYVIWVLIDFSLTTPQEIQVWRARGSYCFGLTYSRSFSQILSWDILILEMVLFIGRCIVFLCSQSLSQASQPFPIPPYSQQKWPLKKSGGMTCPLIDHNQNHHIYQTWLLEHP